MSLRTPGLQDRSQHHPYWGVYSDAVTGLPNQAGNPLPAAQFVLEAGDVAYNDGQVAGTPGFYVCTGAGTAGGGDATWVLVGPGSGGASVPQLGSGTVYTVPAGSVVGDAVAMTGVADTAILADNTLGLAGKVLGIITAKPLATTAFVAYAGEVALPFALTPGSDYYLGTAGGISTTFLDPVANAGSGFISQRVGIARNAGVLVLNVDQPIVL